MQNQTIPKLINNILCVISNEHLTLETESLLGLLSIFIPGAGHYWQDVPWRIFSDPCSNYFLFFSFFCIDSNICSCRNLDLAILGHYENYKDYKGKKNQVNEWLENKKNNPFINTPSYLVINALQKTTPNFSTLRCCFSCFYSVYTQ